MQIVTWNDFPEGTPIEPTVEYGFRWLDAIEIWWAGVTGGTANLEDNRAPLREFLSTCSPNECAESRVVPARSSGTGRPRRRASNTDAVTSILNSPRTYARVGRAFWIKTLSQHTEHCSTASPRCGCFADGGGSNVVMRPIPASPSA